MTLSVWLISLLFSATPPAPTYIGFWLTEDKTTVVEISRQGSGYVGRYVAFRTEPTSAKHQAQANFQVLKELKPDGDDLNGKVLNPDTNKDYKAVLHLTSPQTLELRVKVMGVTAHTETWTRQLAAR